MSFMQRIASGGRRLVNSLIDVISGQRQVASLEGPQSYRTVLALGVIGLGISGFVIWSSLQRVGQVAVEPTNQNTNATPIAELEELQDKDTDEDGLSDYDELFSFKTSPYLRDSDSDGIDDAAEVTGGTDPNCPQGQACTGLVVGTVVNADDELSPEFLRQALRAAGVAQSVLDNLPDDQLLAIYQEVVVQSAGINAESLPSLNDLQQLSGDDIRSLLIESGVSADELSQYDDETLKQIFEQALNQ